MKEFEQDYEGNKVFVDQTRLKESLEEKFDKDGQNILKKICSLN
ncbi:hypothetical protein [Cytobacillus oceanisediminis]|nr:hypothetical protein [Cytobacillus oceanisediminis]